MITAISLIVEHHPFLLSGTDIADVLPHFQSPHNTDHIPAELAVCNEEKHFLGFFSPQHAPAAAQQEPIDLHLKHPEAFVWAQSPYHEVLRCAQQAEGCSVAVLDPATRVYVGTITPRDMIQGMAFFVALRSPGVTLVLKMKQRDYSLSELAKRAEDADAPILDLILQQSSEETDTLFVVLKFSTLQVEGIRETFERHGYHIVEELSGSSLLGEQEKRNYDALMKYLSI